MRATATTSSSTALTSLSCTDRRTLALSSSNTMSMVRLSRPAPHTTPAHLGRYHRGPKDRAMAGLYGLAGSHDCAWSRVDQVAYLGIAAHMKTAAIRMH